MNRILDKLKPERVFYYFEELCNIPHISGHTEAVSSFVQGFAKEKKLDFYSDDHGNVIIYKAASVGYESHPGVILQGHLDMVGAKAPESSHDFLKDPLTLDQEALKEGIITAVDTTLGGDDGIAVAYMLAILEDDAMQHPYLEAVFTTDEEIGLIGATALDYSKLSGKYLLNIDSEEEGIFLTGCAGGMRSDIRLPLTHSDLEGNRYDIHLGGLNGGHSGVSISTGRPSAVVLTGRILAALQELSELAIVSVKSGFVDNAIAKEADLSVITKASKEQVEELLQKLTQDFSKEFRGIDDGIFIEFTQNMEAAKGYQAENIVLFLRMLPYGVQNRNAYDVNLVETSLNPGIFTVGEGEMHLGYSVRSSFESAKRELGDRLKLFSQTMGAAYKETGHYPSWSYNPDSHLREVVKAVYEKQAGVTPVFETIHAGLECGIFYNHMPELDIVSFGPDMKDIHTQDECLYVASVERVYTFITELLGQL